MKFRRSFVAVFYLFLFNICFLTNAQMSLETSFPIAWDFSKDFKLDGNYLYTATGRSGVRVLDISDIDNIEEVSHLLFDDRINFVEISDNTLFALGDELHVVNISNPHQPETVSSYHYYNQPVSMCVNNNMIFVSTEGQSIQIMEISDDSSLEWITTYNTNSFAERLCSHGNYLYYIEEFNNLVITSLTNPEIPQVIGSFASYEAIMNFAVSGNYAYCIIGNELLVLDLSFPYSITQLNSIHLTQNISPSQINIVDEHVFLSGNGYAVVNISDPANPFIVDEVYDEEPNEHSICTDEIMITSKHYVGLDIYDISQPQSVDHLSECYKVARSNRSIIYDDLLIVNGSVVNSSRTTDILIFSICDPGNPVLLSSIPIGENHTTNTLWSIRASDNVLYAAGRIGNHSGISSYDISDPANPVFLDNYTSYREMQGGMHVDGDRLFVNCSITGLTALDISDPENISYLGRDLDSNYYPFEFGYRNNRALVYSGNRHNNQIRILNVFDPTDIYLESFLEDSLFIVTDLDITNDLALIATWDTPLKVIDFRDPVSPAYITEYEHIIASNVRIEDDMAWVIEANGELSVLDISDILNPVIVASTVLEGRPKDLEVNPESGVIVVNNSWFIDILQLTENGIEHVYSGNKIEDFTVSSAWPNPFNSSTRITITLNKAEDIHLRVYDLLGREVFENKIYCNTGESTIGFEAGMINSQLCSGTYFLQLGNKNQSITQKIFLIK